MRGGRCGGQTPLAQCCCLGSTLVLLVITSTAWNGLRRNWAHRGFDDVTASADSRAGGLTRHPHPEGGPFPAIANLTWCTDLARCIRPEQDTTVLGPPALDRGWFPAAPRTGAIRVLVFVTTAPANFALRSSLRQTWVGAIKDCMEAKGHLDEGQLEQHRPLQVRAVFLLGMADLEDSQQFSDLILREHEEHGDLLVETFVDSYQNLTLKTMFMLKHALGAVAGPPEKRPDFILKVDDNCYLNLNGLRKLVLRLSQAWEGSSSRTLPSTMRGARIEARPDRRRPLRVARPPSGPRTLRKGQVPDWMYPADRFPAFLSGSGYMFSSNLVPCLFREGQITPFLNLEDVFITGMVGVQRCGAILVDDKDRFRHLGYPDVRDLEKAATPSDVVIHLVDGQLPLLHEIHRIYATKFSPEQRNQC